MDSIHRFLAHAVRLEAAAAARFDELADIMQTHGNAEVETFFRQMADYSRLHLAEALKRGGFRHVSELPVDGYDWPDGEPPEAPAWWGVDALMDVPAALELALDSERRGLAFYQDVADTSADEKVKAMAAAFAAEEGEHVAEIQSRIARLG
ncbi:MAG: ferritin family protein [Zoogloea sp.]|nr:ferritin family protein [Zoogloea sp.]